MQLKENRACPVSKPRTLRPVPNPVSMFSACPIGGALTAPPALEVFELPPGALLEKQDRGLFLTRPARTFQSRVFGASTPLRIGFRAVLLLRLLYWLCFCVPRLSGLTIFCTSARLRAGFSSTVPSALVILTGPALAPPSHLRRLLPVLTICIWVPTDPFFLRGITLRYHMSPSCATIRACASASWGAAACLYVPGVVRISAGTDAGYLVALVLPVRRLHRTYTSSFGHGHHISESWDKYT